MRLKELFETEVSQDLSSVISSWRQQLKEIKGAKAFGKFSIVAGGVSHLGPELHLYPFMFDDNGELSIPFRFCNNLFIHNTNVIKSFKNFPNSIGKDFGFEFGGWSDKTIWTNTSLSSMEGFPKVVGNRCNLTHFEKLNFHKINEHLAEAKEIMVHASYVGPALSFVKINNLQKVELSSKLHQDKNPWATIITNHLAGEKDIMECKEELMNAGLKEYAKL